VTSAPSVQDGACPVLGCFAPIHSTWDRGWCLALFLLSLRFLLSFSLFFVSFLFCKNLCVPHGDANLRPARSAPKTLFYSLLSRFRDWSAPFLSMCSSVCMLLYFPQDAINFPGSFSLTMLFNPMLIPPLDTFEIVVDCFSYSSPLFPLFFNELYYGCPNGYPSTFCVVLCFPFLFLFFLFFDIWCPANHVTFTPMLRAAARAPRLNYTSLFLCTSPASPTPQPFPHITNLLFRSYPGRQVFWQKPPSFVNFMHPPPPLSILSLFFLQYPLISLSLGFFGF